MRKAKLTPSMMRLAAFFLILVLASSSAWISAQARQWKPSLEAQTQDYLEILDEREGRFTMIWWLASPMIPHNPNAALFDKYVVIMALHAQMSATTGAAYQKIENLDVEDGNHQALTPVAYEKLPPTLTGALSAMGALFKQLLGPMGEHVQYFVYEAGAINACRHGRLFVNYTGESYSYDMPIPGC